MTAGRWSKSSRLQMRPESSMAGPTSHVSAPLGCPCLTSPSGRRARPEPSHCSPAAPQPQCRIGFSCWRAAGSLPPPKPGGVDAYLSFVLQPQPKVRPLRPRPGPSPAKPIPCTATTTHTPCTDPARSRSHPSLLSACTRLVVRLAGVPVCVLEMDDEIGVRLRREALRGQGLARRWRWDARAPYDAQNS